MFVLRDSIEKNKGVYAETAESQELIGTYKSSI